ncbi:MAG: hypothetical protein ACLR76_04890 [Alistipes sp.]
MTYSTQGQHIMNRYGRANEELSVQRQPIRLYFYDEVGLYTVLGRNKHRTHRQDTPNLLAFRRFIDYFAGFSPSAATNHRHKTSPVRRVESGMARLHPVSVAIQS